MQKPMIAKDTKEPLVVMGGYRIAEGGAIMRDPVQYTGRPTVTAEDIALLEKHGVEGLREMQFWGVLDHLEYSELTPEQKTKAAAYALANPLPPKEAPNVN